MTHASGSSSARDSSSSPPGSNHHGRFIPGKIIADRYRIVSLIGKGGMGEVYRADDIKLGHPVALKFLPGVLSNDSERLNYFLSEVRLTRQISHPNVCRVYDIGEVEGLHFLSMEYIDGEDLSVLLRRIGRLPKDKGVQIVRQLCAGLAAAHDRGVLHRDLKPANVMLDGLGQVRITDFGLARLVDDVGDQKIVGTPAYMAPEQLKDGKTTIQSDLYSLGLICYELFTGERVHKSNSIPELLQLHQQESVTAPSSVQADTDPVVERVILRCLEHEAYQRPKSVQEVAAALPGADPLAVALAAGETPSPEMVAAAGDSLRMDSRAAILCLVAVILLTILNAWLFDHTSSLPAFGSKSQPAVMADVARQILDQELGYGREDGIEIYGLLQSSVTEDDTYRFWFRRRPQGREFDTNSYWIDWGQRSRARPTFSRPPWEVGEEVGIQLSGDRKLVYFRAKPPLTAIPETTTEPNWSEWFSPERTGYYLASSAMETLPQDLPKSTIMLERVPDLWRLPDDPYDQIAMWKGQDPDFDEPLYVVTASFRNRPTLFRRVPESELHFVGAGNVKTNVVWFRQALVFMMLMIQSVAVVMAWRHYFYGRGDRRGALKLATFAFIMGIVTLVTQTRYIPRVQDVLGDIIEMGVAQVLYKSAIIWVWYMALEPYVRRVWPHMLISFSRLMNGRIWDPMVGRDVLYSALIATAWAAMDRLNFLIQSGLEFDRMPLRVDPNVMTLLGMPELLGDVASAIYGGVNAVFFLILLLIINKLLLGTKTRALVGFAAILILLLTLGYGGNLWVSLIPATSVAICVLLAVRFGALALASAWVGMELLTRFPITLDASAWYFSHGAIAAILVWLLAAYGCYASRGGRVGWTSRRPPTSTHFNADSP